MDLSPSQLRRANATLLRRRRSVLLPAGLQGEPAPSGQGVPAGYVGALLQNVASLGFTCAPAIVERLLGRSEAEVLGFYRLLVHGLRELVGADRPWQPMYPDFPRQVMAATDAELYLNALMHYLGDWMGLRILPAYVKSERPALADQLDLQVVGLARMDDLFEIGRRLIAANSSISASDQDDVRWLVENFPEQLERYLPTDIPHKENLGFITGLLLEHTERADLLLTRYYKTATDILRLATALSDGDVSLAQNTRFKRFSRRYRRLLLALLDRCRAPLPDMQRYRGRWLRLGERLHPGEYRARFPKAADAFDALRNRLRVPSFNGQVEAALIARDVTGALALLRKRPGELARRLDHLLRLAGPEATSEAVLQAFSERADQVATPVLLQVMAHFAHRPESPPLRAFFPKGNAAKVVTIENRLPPLSAPVCARLARTCEDALRTRFASREPLGRVYVDPALANFLVPFSQRSASKSLRTLVRGSQLPLPAADTVRFFLWWREGLVNGKPTGRVDIDLSAVIYDDQWRYRTHISYTNLRSVEFDAVHSGDITSAPHGACEFIDFNIPTVVRAGGRYVVMSVLAFTQQGFCNLPACFAGWMSRQAPGSGEIFEPSTVIDRVDLAADTRICIPVILDLHERTLYWADLALRKRPDLHANIESNQRGIVHLGRAITGLAKPDLYRLFTLHAEGRGALVEHRDEAEVVFAPDGDVTPFDIERIMADFL